VLAGVGHPPSRWIRGAHIQELAETSSTTGGSDTPPEVVSVTLRAKEPAAGAVTVKACVTGCGTAHTRGAAPDDGAAPTPRLPEDGVT
jgi:hypothetical protein